MTHDEADDLLAYYFINEAVARHSPVKVASSDADVLVILAHHMYSYVSSYVLYPPGHRQPGTKSMI